MRIAITFLIVVIFFSSPVAAANKDVKGSKDYPEIGRLKGSYIKAYKAVDFDEYLIVTEPMQGKVNKDFTKTLEGKVIRIAYYAPKGTSVLEAQRNYEDRLKENGFDVFHSCKGDECYYTLRTVEQFILLWPNTRYSVAKKVTDSSEIHAVVATTTDGSKIVKTSIAVIETALMANKMTDASAMAKAIAESGSIALYGIYFDSGKSTVRTESVPTLKEIALLMGNLPKLKLIVVGHTDNQGQYEYNKELSKERARSVVRELVNKHGINAARLKHDGVGYLAPVSSNHGEDGRAKNRRVQLVEQ